MSKQCSHLPFFLKKKKKAQIQDNKSCHSYRNNINTTFYIKCNHNCQIAHKQFMRDFFQGVTWELHV
jgi:uncharacterized protein YpiB (UPF0302 family)